MSASAPVVPVLATRVSLLGVILVPPPLSEVGRRTFLAGHSAIRDLLEKVTVDARKRQRRGELAPWDALTFLERVPASGDGSQEEDVVARELMAGIAEDRVDPDLVSRLEALAVVRGMRVHLEAVPPRFAALLRSGGAKARAVTSAAGLDIRRTKGSDDIARRVELDLAACGVQAHNGLVNWQRVVSMAALVLLRGDLEIWVGTGFWRTRRCAREGCRSWFRTRRMAAAQKYCSTSCRVMSFQSR